jgi:hypothetical protein
VVVAIGMAERVHPATATRSWEPGTTPEGVFPVHAYVWMSLVAGIAAGLFGLLRYIAYLRMMRWTIERLGPDAIRRADALAPKNFWREGDEGPTYPHSEPSRTVQRPPEASASSAGQ